MEKRSVAEPSPWEIFQERLARQSGGPWQTEHGWSGFVDQHIQITQIDHQQRWCDFDSFWTFLDDIRYRRLLRCLIGRNQHEVGQAWSVEKLQQETQLSCEALEEALAFCQKQAFAQPDIIYQHPKHCYRPTRRRRTGWMGKTDPMELTPEAERVLESVVEKPTVWYSGPNLQHLSNIGPTLEWTVQQLFEHHFQAASACNVTLSRFAGMGDIDVLAFLPDDRSVLVECKSSTHHITEKQVKQFLSKAHTFQANVAVLLIDTDDLGQLQIRQKQLELARRRTFPHTSSWEIALYHAPAHPAICLLPEVYVALSGERLSTTFSFLLNDEKQKPGRASLASKRTEGNRC